ncbi:Alpha/Beta hydrolase protein [Flagelloscypha sp. PMI_526]|nr:Alpha/Beta hydrolase protein [Flagelloscypha sp. PMI_526]
MYVMYLFAWLLFVAFGISTATAGYPKDLTVDTTSGLVTGFIEDKFPNVAQFLGVPFAEQPVGARRWLPPTLKSKETNIFNATTFGHNCPQILYNFSTVWNTDAPEFETSQELDGEDCLIINVWAPNKHIHDGESLPVLAWIYGGGFESGGGNVPYQIPTSWVERSQRHIVVGIAYRAGIFGYPNSAGLKDNEQNLGLLDQRLGLEWVRSNIANFGGDPNRITLWGHSAGGVSVEYLDFAYPEDPIAKGFIAGSGGAWHGVSSSPDQSNFTFVANNFGCDNLSAEAEVDCLRKVSSRDIIAFLEERANAGTEPALVFHPIVDGRTRFANYTERALAGKFTRMPTITGTTVDEATAAILPYNQTYGPNMTLADQATLSFFCRVVLEAQDRYTAHAPTFRYLYGGNFSNISPQWWEGAYHASELPLIFGTSGDYRGASTPFELAVSEKMQDYWLAFAEDPVDGLPAMGWDAYEPDGNGVLLGYESVVSQPISEVKLEAPCTDGFPNGKPPPV